MRWMLVLAAGAMLLSFGAAGSSGVSAAGDDGRVCSISKREVGGLVCWSIHAPSAYPDLVLAALAAQADLALSGLERVESARLHEPFEIALEDRPLAACVRAIAGAAGMRARVSARSIELLPDPSDTAPRAELEQAEDAAWLQFTREHPEGELAAEAELALGDSRERAGELAAARSHYALVARDHSSTPQAALALLREGQVEGQLEDWSAAGDTFLALARLETPHPYAARARLELARTFAARGDGRQALFLLEALERSHPAADAEDVRARLYLRAAASIAGGEVEAGIALLDRADADGPSEGRDPQSEAIRAQALERLGRPAEAARAWLRHAERQSGAREQAWIAAARLSLAAGDALAVLFVDRLAAGTNAAVEITPLVESARASLGLAGSLPAERREEALRRAEDLILTRSFARALGLLEGLWAERERLDEGGLARLAALYARALDAEASLDEALSVLREALDRVEADELRAALGVQAGELYEAHARFDEAIAAYGGSF